jgi:hypothetical protein
MTVDPRSGAAVELTQAGVEPVTASGLWGPGVVWSLHKKAWRIHGV